MKLILSPKDECCLARENLFKFSWYNNKEDLVYYLFYSSIRVKEVTPARTVYERVFSVSPDKQEKDLSIYRSIL